MDFFTWVGDLSGWYWLALGIFLIALEMLAPSFILIWPGLAAIIIAALVALLPDIAGEWLVLIFATLSIALIYIGRGFALKMRKSEPTSTLNSRAQSMIGRQAKVVSFENGEGKITISGVQWPAVWQAGEISAEGHMVVIMEASGVSLTVKNL